MSGRVIASNDELQALLATSGNLMLEAGLTDGRPLPEDPWKQRDKVLTRSNTHAMIDELDRVADRRIDRDQFSRFYRCVGSGGDHEQAICF